MSFTMSVKVDIDLGKKGFDPIIRKAALETKAYAETQLKDVTPVRTGRLAASWDVQAVGNTLTMRNETPYAGFVEYGTRFMKAQPMATLVAPRAKRYFLTRVGYSLGK